MQIATKNSRRAPQGTPNITILVNTLYLRQLQHVRCLSPSLIDTKLATLFGRFIMTLRRCSCSDVIISSLRYLCLSNQNTMWVLRSCRARSQCRHWNCQLYTRLTHSFDNGYESFLQRPIGRVSRSIL